MWGGVGAHAHMCTHLICCVATRGQLWVSLSGSLPLIFGDRISHRMWSSLCGLGWLAVDTRHRVQPFRGCLGSELRSLMCTQEAPYPVSHCPSPQDIIIRASNRPFPEDAFDRVHAYPHFTCVRMHAHSLLVEVLWLRFSSLV